MTVVNTPRRFAFSTNLTESVIYLDTLSQAIRSIESMLTDPDTIFKAVQDVLSEHGFRYEGDVFHIMTREAYEELFNSHEQ